MKISHGRLDQMLRAAIEGKFGRDAWLSETYPDYCVISQDGKSYKVPFALAEDEDSVDVGDRGEEVILEYVPVSDMTAPGSLLAASDGPDGSVEPGFTWRIRVINFGLDTVGQNYYAPEAMRAAKGLYNGARVFALSDSQHIFPGSMRKGKSVREIVGWIDDVTERDNGYDATFHILKAASWLRDMVVDAWEQGKHDLIAFSHDITGLADNNRMVAGKQVRYLKEVKSVQVDVVYDPIGGGKFIRMMAANGGGEEHDMLKGLLAALAVVNKGKHDELQVLIASGGTVTEAEVMGFLAAAPPATPAAEGGDGEAARMNAATDERFAGIEEQLQAARVASTESTLRAALAESGLPEPTKVKLRAAFAGRVETEENILAAIKDEREYLGQVTGSGHPISFGGPEVVASSGERLQAALDRTLGLAVDDRFSDVPAFEGLRAAYARFTGDTEVRGYIADRTRLTAAFDSSSFAYALGNTMYRRMLRDYRESDFGLSRLISTTRRATDYRTLESIRLKYFSDLPSVDPEAADYPELNGFSDEEISYKLQNKGGIVTISRPTILADDLGSVKTIVGRLGRAARRTRARNAWAKLTSNATYKGDSKALFHADHGNLGTDALAYASVAAMVTKLANMTEPGSGETLGLDFQNLKLCLAVPNGLWATAKTINEAQYTDAQFTPNPARGLFGANNENIVVLPLLSDATDFFLLGDPSERDILESAYMNGNEEPEMFLADNPAVGQMFVGDKIQYKIRHEYQDEVADYRNAIKNVVAN